MYENGHQGADDLRFLDGKLEPSEKRGQYADPYSDCCLEPQGEKNARSGSEASVYRAQAGGPGPGH